MVNLDFRCSAGEIMTDAQQIHQLEQRLAELEGGPPEDAREDRVIPERPGLGAERHRDAAGVRGQRDCLHPGQLPSMTARDRAGIAYSLRTQGYINQRLGDYPLGISQLLKAQGLFESLGIEDGLAYLTAWPASMPRSATSPKRSTICTNSLMSRSVLAINGASQRLQ